ncbi:MAG TPA: glycosyl hydrolase [Bacteroides sp.]|nr:glycosyl hydrolase [Bacteroides sp.]
MKPSGTISTALLISLLFACYSCDTSPSGEGTGQKRGTHTGSKTGTQAGPVPFRCTPFDLRDVQLLDGPFRAATELNINSLLNYEPDRLLAKFRIEAGLEPGAEHYHGWEDATIAGHSLGHYLSACALMFRSTGDGRFLERVNYMVAELDSCQEAHGNGYLGAFPDGKRILEEEVGKGIIRAAPFDLNGIWVPFYTQHKVMAGLRDAYRLCDNSNALRVERKAGDWLQGLLAGLSEDQMQEILSCEHGGMNEVLADLYADTGDGVYLDLSRRFHHRAVLDPLAEGVDILPGKHGNTQIPKLVGLARRYELTGYMKDRKAAQYFWERVVNHHSYANGSHGHHEYFGSPDSLSNRLSSNTSESCNVYNMLKLSMHLFSWDASPGVADFYELALINHILSSQHSENGRVLYFHSLQMGGHKLFQDPYDFTCCVGTGMENHSKYGGAVFFHSGEELFVTQFIAAELNWKEKGIVIRQVTNFPEEQGTRLLFLNERPADLILQIRKPSWADERFSVTVNGKRKRIRQQPGSFVTVKGTWKKEDEVQVEMPFRLRLEPMPDDPKRVAIMYGPLVLAADLGPASDEHAADPLIVPGLVTENRDPSAWLSAMENEPNCFMTNGVCRPEDVPVRPLYAIDDHNYTVYWDLYSAAEWQEYLKAVEVWRKGRSELEARTIDYVVPAPGPDNRNHGFRGENPGFYEFNGQPCVEARQGWFSYELRVKRNLPAGLVVEYWTGFLGPREFEIRVNGVPVATENAPGIRTNEKMEVLYQIPSALTGSGTVTVTFDGEEKYAGPVFGVRTIETPPPGDQERVVMTAHIF